MSDTATPTAEYATAATTRNADLATLAAALEDRHTRALDVVVPATALRSTLGSFEVRGLEPILSADGVMDPNGFYTPTPVGDEGVSARLGHKLSTTYLRECRTLAPDLYDANVNGWLERAPKGSKYLLRLLTEQGGPNGRAGVMRAMLSDTFRCIDDFDVLCATLAGLTAAGVVDPIIKADLTDRRMILRVQVPEIHVMAERLLADYRNPWTGDNLGHGWTPDAMRAHNDDIERRTGRKISDPVVFAGLVITNSDTGGSAFAVYPEAIVTVCSNGLTFTASALRKVHLGSKLEEGQVKWSDATLRKNLDLITSQTTDAVAQFLTPEFLAGQIAAIEEAAGIAVKDAPAVIENVAKSLGFSKDDQARILGAFVRGGQMTTGGVMQAVTAAAQELPDADAAWEMGRQGIPALHAAVAAVRK